MRRTGDLVFRQLAIVAGIGLIAAMIVGIEVSRDVLIVIALVVIGWAVYHWIVVRPALYGVPRPDASEDHE